MAQHKDHVCTIRAADDFEADSLRTVVEQVEGKTINVIVGTLKAGRAITPTVNPGPGPQPGTLPDPNGSQTGDEIQAYAYPSEEWSEDEANSHCEGKSGIAFEMASNDESSDRAGGNRVEQPFAFGQRTWRLNTQGEVTIEKRADKATVIRGYAARYYDGTPGTEFRLFAGAVERIMPGAFKRALEGGGDVVGLFNHDTNLILGRRSAGTLKLSDSSFGLVYEIKPPATTVGRDVTENVRVRNVTGSSFSFNVPEGGDTWRHDKDGGEIREIHDVDLFDVGPVVFPAYEAATAEAASADGKRSLKLWLAHRDLTKADDWLKIHQLPDKGQAP